jgi:hypothetical protein
MEFLKKHYEKILLGVVLLAVAVAAGFLPIKITSEKQKLTDLNSQRRNPKAAPLTNLDLTISDKAIARMSAATPLDFGPPNKLFNPMPWQQTRDVPPKLIPGTKVGPAAVMVTNITPLYLQITLDQVTVSDSGPKYVIGVEKQAAANPRDRTKKEAYCRVGDKNDTFKLLEIKGPADNPTNVVVELNDTGENAVVSKDPPFKRVDGYLADLRYAPENKPWPARRVGNTLSFNGEDYKIVTITKNEVVLLAPNQKKWTIKSSTPP